MKFTALALSSLLCGLSSAQTIVDFASGDENFSTLAAAVSAAGLFDALNSEGPFTVFAPNNDAFDMLPDGTVERLLEDEWNAHLTGILQYHVVAGTIMSTDLMEGMTATTLLEGADLNVTSLSPVQINGVDVITADVSVDNGVIHVVDEVLLPPFMMMDIVSTAQANSEFSTLVDLVVTADLVEALMGSGLTVFAPTNDAFEKLDEETLTALGMPENKQMLVDILTYHVVPNVVVAGQLTEGAMVDTLLEDQSLTITLEGGAKVNGISITATDILTSNGVIHVVDQVIIPPTSDDMEDDDMESEDETSGVRGFSTFLGVATAFVAMIL